MANNLYNAIRVAHRSPTAILDLLVDGFNADYRTFAQGNNRTPLEAAVGALTGAKLDKALAWAVSKGYQAGGLCAGYVGAVSGKYSAQPAEVREKYEGAIERATSAFRVALTDSGLFAEKEEKANKEAEKAKKAAEKAKKEADTRAAVLVSAVASGEIVMAKDVHPVPDTREMVKIIADKIIAGLIAPEDGDLLFNGLVSRMDLGLLQLVQKRIANEISAKTTVNTVADTVADTVPA